MTQQPQGGTEAPAVKEVDLRQAFAWYDNRITGSESRAVVKPLALVARATQLCESLTQQATETSPGESVWIVYGVAEACKTLVAAGDLGRMGVLLTGLETLIDPEIRAKWPLHEKCAPIRGL